MTLRAEDPSPPTRTDLVATWVEPLEESGVTALLERLPPAVTVLEIRGDRGGDPAPEVLEALRRARPGLQLLYTLRSAAEGGGSRGVGSRGSGSPGGDGAERRRRITAAAALYDLVDLEAERDLEAQILEAVGPEQRILSWHGSPQEPAEDVGALAGRVASMAATPARLYKLIPAATQAGEELAPLRLLVQLGRRDVVAFASGPVGSWTRLLAPRLGAPWVYGALAGSAEGAPGQLTVDRLIDDFCLPELPPVERLCGLVGRPVDHSLSPRLHNAAYRRLGLPYLYLPFYADHFGDFWLEVVESGALGDLGFPLVGLSVTAPFKEVALAVAGASSPRAQAIGAANTLVVHDGVWEAESTDPEGVVLPIEALGVALSGARVAILGAGGAGRAAAVGLGGAGARVTLVNRGRERGERVAGELALPFVPLEDFDPAPFPVLVQATSVGREEDDPLHAIPLLFDPERLAPDAVVVDLVYGEGPTPLLEAVAAAGRRPVDGREVLLYQALEQFRRMTGHELPLELAREALGLDRT